MVRVEESFSNDFRIGTMTTVVYKTKTTTKNKTKTKHATATIQRTHLWLFKLFNIIMRHHPKERFKI